MTEAIRRAIDIPYMDEDMLPRQDILVVQESVISNDSHKLKDVYRGFFT